MATALKLVNGIPRMRNVDAGNVYDETILVGVGGITTGVDITLPASGDFEGDELEIYLNGDFMEPGIDYNYVGGGPTFTQIEMTFDLVEGDRLRFRIA